jgi:hypothetical protein
MVHMAKNSVLTKTIESELDFTGIDSEKAKDFFSYLFNRTLSKIAIANDETVKRSVRTCVAMIGQADFPWIKPNGKVLLIPAAVILDELLYTDMQMSLFFMNFVAFYLLLVLVLELYPDFFAWLSNPPYLVPASFAGDHCRNAEAIRLRYMQDNRMKQASPDPGMKSISEDHLHFNIVRALSGCAYLPLGTNYASYNRSIFAGFK